MRYPRVVEKYPAFFVGAVIGASVPIIAAAVGAPWWQGEILMAVCAFATTGSRSSENTE